MNNDNMDKLKHEHGITDEHGYHKDQHQVHHAGHDHCGHSCLLYTSSWASYW